MNTDDRHSAVPTTTPLSIPTDLLPAEVHAVVGAINPLIADAIALYLKTKSYHWHLAGPHFRDYHLLFDEQAGQLLASVDPLAERVRKLGGTTIRSIGHVAALQAIPDDDEAMVPATEMLRRLLEDNRHLAARQRAAIAVCDANRDSATSNLLQGILDETERRIWFLFEASREES
jgi:starvation-inducible DNA-binding protein